MQSLIELGLAIELDNQHTSGTSTKKVECYHETFVDSARAKRRAAEMRMKNRARRVMRLWAGNRQVSATPQAVGVNASTHCRPCSCYLCQPGREVPPLRERAFHDMELS
jgi:hypothetical protein